MVRRAPLRKGPFNKQEDVTTYDSEDTDVDLAGIQNKQQEEVLVKAEIFCKQLDFKESQSTGL